MTNEEQLKQTKAFRKQSEYDVNALAEKRKEIDDEIARLEKAIAEEKKPKLRHGALCVQDTVPKEGFIYIDQPGKVADCAYFAGGVRHTNYSESHLPFTVLAYAFDEIEQLAKGPLKEFTVRHITVTLTEDGDLKMTHDIPGTS